MKLLKDILTGVDNQTYDNAKVLCFLSHMVYFALSFVSYVINKPWAPLDFAGGISAMAVGFGIHIYMKKE